MSQFQIRQVAHGFDRVGDGAGRRKELGGYHSDVAPAYSRDALAVVTHGSYGSGHVRATQFMSTGREEKS